MSQRPNFFIVGAPKCGTTALYCYLCEHPQVFMPYIKEPNFFCYDFPSIREMQAMEDYLALFSEASNEHTVLGEASVWYMYSSEAIKQLKEHAPDAKIIALVRNPVELVQSMHTQHLYSGWDTETDFVTAWRNQFTTDNPLVRYGEIAKLGLQTERLLEHFPESQVKILVYEDFFKNIQQEYSKILEFLGLPDDQRTEFPRVNASKTVRSKGLENFIRHSPKFVESMATGIKKVLGIERLNIMKRIGEFNQKRIEKKPVSEAVLQELKEYFVEDVNKLSALLKQDLTTRYLG